jgi:hypothetical protein
MEPSEDIQGATVRMRLVMALLATLFVVMALWMLALSFVVPITPDASIYLLHARTFSETLNRFALSHDSKGIMLSFLLALPVKLFGATMVAGALAQAVAYCLTAGIMVWFLRTRIPVAISLACLWLVAAFNPLMWGGRVRPEDFGIVFSMIALLAAHDGRLRGLVVCGVMAAMGFFTKGSLVLAPMGIGVVACVLRTRRGSRTLWSAPRDLALLAAGFIAVTVLVLGWIALIDDMSGWFRQTLQWPAEYKRSVGKASFSLGSVGNLFALLQAGRLQWLFVGSVAGLYYGWRSGARRLVILVGALLALECARVIVEGAPWHYLVAGMVAPMVLGCSLFGRTGDGKVNGRGVGVVLLLLSPILIATLPDALLATEARVLRHQRTPLETLAARMAPHYEAGEQIMESGQDYQLLLHLNAPRPYPILSLHFHSVSAEEYAAVAEHFTQHPPEWIIDSWPQSSPVQFHCIGHPDRLTYAYISDEQSTSQKPLAPIRLGDRYPSTRPAAALPRKLLLQYPYALAVDTGKHQAWRLVSER